MSRQPNKLDADYGPELRQYIRETAAARGIPDAVLVRELAQEARLRDSLIADAVAGAVLALAASAEPDERYDPADDPRGEVAVATLAALLGSLPAAQGVAQALNQLWVARTLRGGDE